MLKHTLFILIASVLVILFNHQLGYLLNYLFIAHHFISEELAKVFAGGVVGSLIRYSLSLFLIPLIVALIPSLIYWGIKRSWLRYFVHIFWVVWIILATILVIK